MQQARLVGSGRFRMPSLAGSVRRFAVSAALGLALLAGAARPASAQFGPGGGWREMQEPSINSKEIEKYGEMIKMTPEQVTDAKNLLEGFTTEYSGISKEMRDAFEAVRNEAQDSGDPSVWRDLGTAMQGYQSRIKKLEASYFDDVKLLLNEQQLAEWPRVERARRREHSLPRGGLVSGESVDVIKLVRDAKLDPKTLEQVQPLLDLYDTELDRVLAERDKIYEDSMSQGMQLWFNQQMDKIQELFDKSRDAAVKVRDVNRKYARQVEAALPEDKQAAFEKEVKKASFPRVYRPSYVGRSFETASQFTDLSADQKKQLDELKVGYERDLNVVNEKLAASIEETELKRTAMQMFGMGGPQNEGARELRDQRRAIEDAAYEKIKAVLNDDQKKKLPEKPAGANFRRGGPGGPGGGGQGGGARRDGM